MITLSTKWKEILEDSNVLFRDHEPIVIVPNKTPNIRRLRCQYCGRIALTERETCEGCGAVLPWEIEYEA